MNIKSCPEPIPPPKYARNSLRYGIKSSIAYDGDGLHLWRFNVVSVRDSPLFGTLEIIINIGYDDDNDEEQVGKCVAGRKGRAYTMDVLRVLNEIL